VAKKEWRRKSRNEVAKKVAKEVAMLQWLASLRR
jgi:hypothetical protein